MHFFQKEPYNQICKLESLVQVGFIHPDENSMANMIYLVERIADAKKKTESINSL